MSCIVHQVMCTHLRVCLGLIPTGQLALALRQPQQAVHT
jgi:hypothetical protein